MRNFDYLQELGLTDLHRFCSAAEELQLSNPDLSAISARKASSRFLNVPRCLSWSMANPSNRSSTTTA